MWKLAIDYLTILIFIYTCALIIAAILLNEILWSFGATLGILILWLISLFKNGKHD